MFRSAALSHSGLRRRHALAFATAAALAMAPEAALADTAIQAEAMTLSSSGAGGILTDANASGGKALKIWSNGSASKSVAVAENSAKLVLRARGQQCSGAPKVSVYVDGNLRLSASVSSTSYADYAADLSLAAGTHTVRASFTNDYRSSSCDRNVILDSISLKSPTTTSAPAPTTTTVNTSTTAPTGLKATVVDGVVTLDWDDYPSDKLAYYAVRRGTQPDPSTGTWTRLATNWTTSTATDKPASGTYYYYVTAIDTSKVVSPRSAVHGPVTVGSTSTASPTPTPAPEISGTETTPTPAPTTADPVIAAAGDIACDPASSSYNGGSGTSTACRQKATSDLIYNRGFSKVLTLGDNQYESGTLSAFNKAYAPTWGRFKSITSPAIGNHEYRVSGAAGHFDYFNGVGVSSGPAGSRGKGYYSYNVGDWHIIALNSNCSYVSCAVGSAQEAWLKADLAANTAKCTLAYWHHPRFSSGSHGNNTAVDPLYKALYAANADVVLSGHDHSYERFAPQNPSGGADSARGIRQFVVGTGGKNAYSFGTTKSNSQVRNSGTFGVLELSLRPTSYDWKFQPEAGRSFTDAGSTGCH